MKKAPTLTIAATVLFIAAGLYGLWSTAGAQSQADQPDDQAESTDSDSTNDAESSTNSDNEPVAPQDAAEADQQAKAVLNAARDRLLNFESYQAEMEQSVNIGPRKFVAKGRYLQGANLKLQLKYQAKVGQTDASLLQVCDGQILWTQMTVGETSEITRRDVKQILQAYADRFSQQDGMLEALLALGGLPALLASIEKNFTFDSVQFESINNQTVTVLEGTWPEAVLARWRPEPSEPPELPSNFPDRIRLFFDADHNPQRIEYLKQVSGRNYMRAMVRLDFKKIVLNPRLSDDAFLFIPPDGVYVQDVTTQVLNQLQAAPPPSAP